MCVWVGAGLLLSDVQGKRNQSVMLVLLVLDLAFDTAGLRSSLLNLNKNVVAKTRTLTETDSKKKEASKSKELNSQTVQWMQIKHQLQLCQALTEIVLVLWKICHWSNTDPPERRFWKSSLIRVPPPHSLPSHSRGVNRLNVFIFRVEGKEIRSNEKLHACSRDTLF